MDLGISEKEFWEMTFAELERALESKQRTIRAQERKQASYDYILGDLIGRSFARLYNKSSKYPPINEVYPSLFTKEEVEAQYQEMKQKQMIARFRSFATAHNTTFEGGEKKIE